VTSPPGNNYLDTSDRLSSHWCQSCKSADAPTPSTNSLAFRSESHAQHWLRKCSGTEAMTMNLNPSGVRFVGTDGSASKSDMCRPLRPGATPATPFAKLIQCLYSGRSRTAGSGRVRVFADSISSPKSCRSRSFVTRLDTARGPSQAPLRAVADLERPRVPGNHLPASSWSADRTAVPALRSSAVSASVGLEQKVLSSRNRVAKTALRRVPLPAIRARPATARTPRVLCTSASLTDR
jgi:hypothetical protein